MPTECLRIGIDARLLRYRRGIGNFVFNLVDSLARQNPHHDFLLYTDTPEAREFAPSDSRFTVKVLRPKLYPLWEQVILPRQVAKDQLDVLHCPANAAPLFLNRSTALVLTIHDVMYMLPPATMPVSPSLYQRVGRGYLRQVVPRVINNAAAVTTISNFSQRDICENLGRASDDVVVIYEAPGRLFRRLPRSDGADNIAGLGVTAPFILAMGALDPRKNTARLLAAFGRTGGQTGLKLVIVGLSKRARSHFAEMARSLGLEEAVLLLGFVTEEELVSLYNAAEIMLYPSLYEGFGMPVLEAMACGTPVIASTSAAIPEIAGDAAELVDPTNTDALACAIVRVSGDATLRREMTDRGYNRAGEFSWDTVARKMLDVYEAAVARS
jgi:glycosyltransferase involved in cell wall biosynthesis